MLETLNYLKEKRGDLRKDIIKRLRDLSKTYDLREPDDRESLILQTRIISTMLYVLEFVEYMIRELNTIEHMGDPI